MNPVPSPVPGAAVSEPRLVHPDSGAVLPLMQQPGYYPGYSTLLQQNFWDPATRRTILSRMRNIPPIRFFTPEEVRLMEQITDHLLPQSDRAPERRIPIVPFIDERLYQRRTPGYRFSEMPPDGEAYRMGFEAIERMAQHAFQRPFEEVTWEQQEQLLKSLHDAEPWEGAQDIWVKMPPHRYWVLLVQDCIESYYSHPWAWDEIGFGGPAYPRAYTRLENGEPEPWEKEESRYEWAAPSGCVSDPEEADLAAHRHHPVHGQGGTH